jgi:uncharacterized lipoprotein YddW (UPF0748 family)
MSMMSGLFPRTFLAGLFLIAGIFFSAGPCFSENFTVNALWVPCETAYQPLSDIKKIDELIDFCVRNRINTLLVQVYRGNRTWYAGNMADDTPARSFTKKFGTEMLPYLLKKAHAKKISVHAWFNLLRIAKNKEAFILKKYGKNILTRDSKGRSILDYPDFTLPKPEGRYYEIGDPEIWLDAGNPDVQSYLAELVKDFLSKYPDIDGIHGDFVRLPIILPIQPGSHHLGLSFGYGYESVKRFRQRCGIDPLGGSLTREQSLLWDNFRREQITDVMKKIKEVCRKSGKPLSAAVHPLYSHAYLACSQDWPLWLEKGIMDFAVVMNYTENPELFRFSAVSCDSFKKISPPSARVIMGIGEYLLKSNPKVLEEEVSFLKKTDADGICIFSYDSLMETKKNQEIIYSIINR